MPKRRATRLTLPPVSSHVFLIRTHVSIRTGEAVHFGQGKTDLSKIKTDNVKLGIRAEFISLSAKKSAGAIQADVTRMEDFGNYRLITLQVGDMVVKAKAKREAALLTDKVWVTFPAERWCVYADEVLV